MIRRTVIGVITAAALFGVAAGSAGASSLTVTQAIKAQDKIVHSNATYKSLKGFKVDTVAEAEKAIPKYEALEKLLRTAATVVAGASSTAAQKPGQKDWVTGVRTLAAGFGYFVTELNDIVHGNKTAAKSAGLNAVKFLKVGNADGVKGDRLLGLPTSD